MKKRVIQREFPESWGLMESQQPTLGEGSFGADLEFRLKKESQSFINDAKQELKIFSGELLKKFPRPLKTSSHKNMVLKQ